MGYIGYSMSVNAGLCYDQHIMPMSKWTKEEILSEIMSVCPEKYESYKQLKLYQLRYLLSYDSWHHTSSHFNETSFYAFDVDKFNETSIDFLREIAPDEKPQVESGRYVATVQIWGGTRRHPKMLGTEKVEGIKKGDWLITDYGKKYKLTANKTVEYHKL